jgi:hypothetical protein
MPQHETITPLWLTERLRLNGYSLSITDVEVTHARKTNNSPVYHLKVTPVAPSDSVPARLFLKIPASDFVGADREILFYRDIVPAMQAQQRDLPFIRSFDLDYQPESGHSHLLLEDLSDTHFNFGPGTFPARHHYEQAVEGFALLHAFWWEHPGLNERVGQALTADMIMDAERQAQAKFAGMSTFLGDRMSADQRQQLAHIVAGWPTKRRERVINQQGVTLVHRDPHPHNFLYPRQQGAVKIIDWQSWRVDTGTDDLAYMIACHWGPSARAELELPLLRRYHARLIELGIANYAWSDCLYDYQASIVRCLFFLVNAWSSTQWELKWSRIQHGLLAFRQFSCADILP